MMLRLRFLLSGLRDVGAYTVRSGRWWAPLMLLVLGLAVLVASASQSAVPVAVYTLF